MSQAIIGTPVDFGAHQRMKSSGFVHASKTMRTGASNIRVMTSSRSDLRSTSVRLSPLAPMGLLLLFQFLNHLVECIETRLPSIAAPLDPGCLVIETAGAQPADAHAADLLRDDEPGLFKDRDMLLH